MLNAYAAVILKDLHGWRAEAAVAATLRAVADQADWIGEGVGVPAHDILSIATELENTND